MKARGVVFNFVFPFRPSPCFLLIQAIMFNANHIQEISTLCFLLNGRKRDKSLEYSCGFFPKKINTIAHGRPSAPKIEIDFNGIEIGCHNSICIVIDSKSIFISADGKEFLDDTSKANAVSIFGRKAVPYIIITEAKWALCEILKEYREEVDGALAKYCGVAR